MGEVLSQKVAGIVLSVHALTHAGAQHRLWCAHRIMYGEQARFFDDEVHPTIKHSKKGLVAMAGR